jgi:hypothetical protein
MRVFVALLFTLFVGISHSLAQCPTITVTGPAGVTRQGDTMTFRVEVDRSDLTFSWTVNDGTITKGQGTSSIEVTTNAPTAGSNITATVEVQGLPLDCTRVASESAPVWDGGCGLLLVDEWESLRPNDERGRLDSFFIELSNNPANTGVVVLQVAHKERFDSGNKRLQLVVRHARFRKFDLNRILFVLDRTGRSRTKLHRLPPGEDPFACDGPCITIKGGDL